MNRSSALIIVGSLLVGIGITFISVTDSNIQKRRADDQHTMMAELVLLDDQVTSCQQELSLPTSSSSKCEQMLTVGRETFGDSVAIWFGVKYRQRLIDNSNAAWVERSLIRYDDCRVKYLIARATKAEAR